MRGILRRLGVWLHWGREQRELHEEMAAHRAMAAERAMGNELAAAEDARAVWLWPWLEALGQGVRQGARRLRRAPGFALVGIVTLALGMGATTAIFSVVEAVMLRPLPYPEPGRLVAFELHAGAWVNPSLTVPQVEFLAAQMHTLAAVGGYRPEGEMELHQGTATDWVSGLMVTPGFFAALGVAPRLGRDFSAADAEPGTAGTVVLSDGLWRGAFGGGAVVGKAVRIGDEAYTVIGVMPRGFAFAEYPSDVYTALRPSQSLGDRGLNTEAIGRLGGNATARQADAEAAGLSQALWDSGRLKIRLNGQKAAVGVLDYQGLETRPVRSSLWMLLAAVGLLLAIACANVAGLVLARTLARRQELELRRALGAGRGRLLVQFVGEGMVLAAGGAAAGLGLAEMAVRGLAAKLPWDVPLAGAVGLDGRVLGFALAATLGASVVVGMAAAWQGAETRLAATTFRRRGRGRDVLVAGEVALTVLLLAGAGLLLASLGNLERQPLGFEPAGRTVFSVQLPQDSPQFSREWQFDEQVLARLRALAGVRAAAAISVPPLEGQSNLPAETPGAPALGTAVEFRTVSPGYFAAMGIPLLAGRDVDTGDSAAAPQVVVVNQALARHWFAGASPLGGQVRLGVIGDQVYLPADDIGARTIVGVVADTRTQRVDQPMRLTVYLPEDQMGGAGSFVVRGAVNEAQLRQAVAAVDAEARVHGVATMAAVVAHTLARPRFEAQMVELFAGLALGLAAVGLYGLLAYRVEEQRREIGVRLALGARPGAVWRQVAGGGLRWALGGIACGVVAAFPLGHFIASLLFGVAPTDAATLGAAAAVMIVVAGAACALPAWRATRLDPAWVLRAE